MALNAATLNAIQKAQLGFDQGVQAGVGFSQAFDTAYKAKVEKLAKRAEEEEKYRLDAMDLIDQYEAENQKLGIFSDIAAKNILSPARDTLFDVSGIESKSQQELMQRDITKDIRAQMKPLADANLYLQGLIKSNADVSFSNSLSNETIELNGKTYNKKKFLQALGSNHIATDLNTIFFKLPGEDGEKEEDIYLPISKLKEDQFKYDNINPETLADHDVAMNRFTTSARQSNFTGAQVDNMVNEFLINQPESVKRDLAYNYYQKDEDDEENVEAFLKERMRSKIQAGYAYKEPEAEKPKELKSGEAYYNAAIKSIDELPNSINPSAFKMSSKKDYYLSTLFTNKLPEGYISSGEFDEDGDLIIQNANNNKQVLIKENEPLSAVKAKLKSIATGRSRFFTQ